MPRNGRGGARTGRPGTAYANRSDLSAAAPLPAQAPAGQEYGARLAQLQAQQAVPIAPAPPGGTTAPGGGGAPPAAGAPPPGPAPGEVMPLGAPTQRPDEPVTHGLPTGPGAGPGVIQPPTPPDPLLIGAAVLNSLGDGADAETRQLRAVINAHLANQAAP